MYMKIRRNMDFSGYFAMCWFAYQYINLAEVKRNSKMKAIEMLRKTPA